MVYWVDNPSAVAVKPKKDLVHSAVAKWFNDQLGVTPTIPRAEWFNMIQSEMLSIADALGVKPDKLNDAQIGAALKLVLAKMVTVTSVLGDSKELAASQYLANENNKAAKNAQTAANNANDKAVAAQKKAVAAQNTANTANTAANNADTKAANAQTTATGAKTAADNAQKKANQVPKPVLDQLPIGASGTAYKLITIADLKTKLGVPAKTNVVQTTGTSTTDVISQKGVTDAISEIISFNKDYQDVTSLRSLNQSYTNNTERFMTVILSYNRRSGGKSAGAYISGFRIETMYFGVNHSNGGCATLFLAPGKSYSLVDFKPDLILESR